MPSTKRPQAQLAFKNSMVHGILQFTPGIAFCYVLHRCESQDIRCRESCDLTMHHCTGYIRHAKWTTGKAILVFLDAMRRRRFFWTTTFYKEGGRPVPRDGCKTHRPAAWMTCSRFVLVYRVTTMILPQVHLRKPCYDSYFL